MRGIVSRFKKTSKTNKAGPRAAALLLAAVLSVMSCGCGTFTEKRPAPTLNIPETAKPAYDIPGRDKAGGSIVIGVCGLDTLNPLESTNDTVLKFMTLVYESLVIYGVDASAEPCIAEEWSTADDGRTWLFKLREDVYFHDGAQLTAYDVKNTIEYIKEKGGTYGECVSGISEVNVTARHELEIISESPDAFIPYKMIFPIVKSENTDDLTQPDGTGKYKYSGSDGKTHKFVLNDRYRGEMPLIGTIEIRDFSSQEELYNSGSDVMLFSEDAAVKYSSREGYTSCSYEDNIATCLVPSAKAGISLKRFINGASDRRTLMNAVIAGKGTVKLIPVFSGTYYQAEYSESGYDSSDIPESVSMIVDSDDKDILRLSQALKKMLAEKNVECTVTEYARDEFAAAVLGGDYDFAAMNLEMSVWPDLYELFATDGRLNYNGYTDESMDSLTLSLRLAFKGAGEGGDGVQGAASFADYAAAQTAKIYTRASETLPIIGLYSKNATVLIKNNVKGVQKHNFTFWNTFGQIGSWYTE